MTKKKKKGFFGSKDNVLHSGEGAIHSIAWRAKLIAWANDIGVKVRLKIFRSVV